MLPSIPCQLCQPIMSLCHNVCRHCQMSGEVGKNLFWLRTTALEGTGDVGESELPEFHEEPYVVSALLDLQGSHFCHLPKLSSSLQAPLEGVSRISVHIMMNPPVLYSGHQRRRSRRKLRGLGRRTQESHCEDPKWLPFSNLPRQGKCGLSQAQERPRNSEACFFASVYQLSLLQSFPNDMSKSPGQQLAAWFGRIPFSFPMFYDFFFCCFSKSSFTS